MQLPILDNKIYDSPSIFTVENLLREARRQKAIAEGSIPTVCILDPDDDRSDSHSPALGMLSHEVICLYIRRD